MKNTSLATLCVAFFTFSTVGLLAQQRVQNPDFEKLLENLLNHNVPEMDISKALNLKDSVLFLDARELNEYRVSRLPQSLWVGYEDFSSERLVGVKKNQPIVVYCSVGYRSERITRKLLELGFAKVTNLYGGIFEWVNRGAPLSNDKGITTKIHTYNKEWSRWVTDRAQKTY
jgi:rhodanese-related sulfurtransferase